MTPAIGEPPSSDTLTPARIFETAPSFEPAFDHRSAARFRACSATIFPAPARTARIASSSGELIPPRDSSSGEGVFECLQEDGVADGCGEAAT